MQKVASTGFLQEQKVLDQQESDISTTNKMNILKINYLSKQKERLQTQIVELKLNNQVIRKINQSIAKQEHPNLKQLMDYNQRLQKLLEHSYEQIRQLKTQSFLAEQVNLDNEKEFRQILYNYENKILELRKVIQIKQSNIQNLEQSQYSAYYFASVDEKKVAEYISNQEIKDQLFQFRKKNDEITKDNQRLRKQNQQLKEKNDKLELFLKSKSCYQTFLMQVIEKKTKSVPKKIVVNGNTKNSAKDIKNLKKPEISVTGQTFCETRNNFSKNMYSAIQVGDSFGFASIEKKKLIELKKLAQGKVLQNERLKNQIHDLLIKIVELKAENKRCLDSNEFYQKSRRKVTQQCNMYQQMVSNLVNYLTQRKSSQLNLHPQSKQLEMPDFLCAYTKNQLQKLQKKPSPVQQWQREDWQNMKKDLQVKLKSITLSSKQKKLSLSCVLDYVSSPNGECQKQGYQDDEGEDEGDFSLALDQSFVNGKINVNVNEKVQSKKKIDMMKVNQFQESGIFSDVLKNM